MQLYANDSSIQVFDLRLANGATLQIWRVLHQTCIVVADGPMMVCGRTVVIGLFRVQCTVGPP